MVLADGEHDGLADLAADRIAQGVLQEGLAEELVGGLGVEALLELALLVGLAVILSLGIGERDDEPLLGEELRGHFRAGVHHGRVDQVSVIHAVEQRISEGGVPALAAEGAVGVEEEAPFGFARVMRRGAVLSGALQIVAGRGRQAELAAHEKVEHRAGVAADGAVRLVGDYEIEIGGREKPPVFVVEQERLNGGDDDLGAPPVVPVLLVDDRLKVRREQRGEDLPGLFLQFQPIHQEEGAAGVAGTKEQLDDGGGGEGLAGAGSHFEEKAVAAVFHRLLEGMDRFELIGAQKAQFVGLDEAGSLGFVLPRGFGGVVRPLREDDVVVSDPFIDQAPRVGRDLLVAGYRIRRRERGDDVGIAALQIPEVMQVAVRQDDEAAILRAGVFAGLLLAGEGVPVLGLGLQDDQGKPLGVEEQEVDETFGGILEVVAQGVEVGCLDRDACLKADVGGLAPFGEEAPAGRFEQPVDLDAGSGFVHADGASFAAPWDRPGVSRTASVVFKRRDPPTSATTGRPVSVTVSSRARIQLRSFIPETLENSRAKSQP